MILDELLQGFVGNAAQGEIAVILPALRKQIDEGQEINRRFKDADLIILSQIAESVALIRSSNVQMKLILCAATVGVSGHILRIPAYENDVMKLGIFVDISGVQEEIKEAFVNASFCYQIVPSIRVCHIPKRQVKLR